MYVAQAIPKIDTAGAEKSPFRTETRYNRQSPHSSSFMQTPHNLKSDGFGRLLRIRRNINETVIFMEELS